MKKCLIENEIYFKIFAYLLIPVMAVILSLQANTIANKQAQILEEQAQILRQQQLPIITTDVELLYDERVAYYTDDILRVYNEGAPLRNFNVYDAVFFLVEYGSKNEPLQKALIPVIDYYFVTTHSAEATGLLATLFSEQNNILFSEIEESFRQHANDNNAYGFLSVNRYLEITYTDIFGDDHSEIHYAHPVYGSSELTSGIRKLAALQAIRLHYESPAIGLYTKLADATPENLLEKLQKFQLIKEEGYPILHFLW